MNNEMCEVTVKMNRTYLEIIVVDVYILDAQIYNKSNKGGLKCN